MEAQRKVENIFGVDDRTKALEAILGKNGSHSTQLSPAFLPASMQNAFVYKYVSGLHPNDLSRLDKAYLDKIGTQEVSTLIATFWFRADCCKDLTKCPPFLEIAGGHVCLEEAF